MKNNEKITTKDKIIWFWLDVVEFIAKIEMNIRYLLKLNYYKSKTSNNIPKDTFYCYEGCRIYGARCPYLDYSKINKENYCHYEKSFGFPLLNDECKICGISEFDGDE